MIDGALIDDMADAAANDRDYRDPAKFYDMRGMAHPEQSMPVLYRLISSRTCNGRRLRVRGQISGAKLGEHRWRVVQVEATDTGESMGTRWIRRDSKMKWIVTAVEPS